VLRRVPHSTVSHHAVAYRSITVPIAALEHTEGRLSIRVAMDVSVLPRGDYGVYLLLPGQTGGAWAPGRRSNDERLIRIYSAPYPPPTAICCALW